MSVADEGQPSPREVETWKPRTDQIVGNYQAMEQVRLRLRRNRPEGEANFLLVGEQGTGPSATLLAFIRQLLKDPAFGIQEDPDWSLKTGQIYRGMRIYGASINKTYLENQVELAIHGWGTRHTFVLLNSLDRAFERGLDGPLVELLSHPDVTTFATATRKEYLRIPGSQEDPDGRLKDLLCQFRIRRQTENPTADELFRFLSNC